MWYTTAPRFKHPSNWTFVGKLLCLCLSPSLCTPRMVHMGFIRPLCSLGLCSSFSRLGGSETVSLTKYFSYCARSALRSEQKLVMFSFLRLCSYLSVFSCQILSQSPCLYVLATSRSRQGISPSTTAQPLSSCLAASRELSPMIYQLCSLSVSSWSVLFMQTL